MQTSPFEGLTLELQLQMMAHWTKPICYCPAATFLVRLRQGQDVWEFLVARRLRGAQPGRYQAHHGGYLDPLVDATVPAAAVREVGEETGYQITEADLTYLGAFGPWLFYSWLEMAGGELVLTITDKVAEPIVPYVGHLFLARVDNAVRVNETDGEVDKFRWMTATEILAEFASPNHEKFIYFHYLFHALRKLHQGCVGSVATADLFPEVRPGRYTYRMY